MRNDLVPPEQLEIETGRASYPIQGRARSRPTQYASVNRAVYLAAYDVYVHCWGKQDAMLKAGCRGGFSTGEVIAFLYARGFPRPEWRDRVEEALRDLDIS